ncbi:MAG: epoxyqueuosine reductase QueH [Firmicutes bacterium]|nr:epoxyqueuosine reductase QueH [Bacillota bacterium]
MKTKPQMECINIEQNILIAEGGNLEVKLAKPTLLIHSCCGPCSSAVLERLVDEFQVTVYYYNPCITDEEEYKRRRETQLQLIEKFNADHIGESIVAYKEGPYCPGAFLELVRGHEDDPEGGVRCAICFRQRLDKVAETARLSGFDYFGTTLTVSPHKNYKKISEIGSEIALFYGVSFLDRDFKKKDGFKRSVELSKKYGLYRQDYCGCKFSKWY